MRHLISDHGAGGQAAVGPNARGARRLALAVGNLAGAVKTRWTAGRGRRMLQALAVTYWRWGDGDHWLSQLACRGREPVEFTN